MTSMGNEQIRVYAARYIYDVGSTISINCTVTPQIPYMGMMAFVHSSSNDSSCIQPSHVIENRVELVIEDARIMDSGTYSCHYGNCHGDRFLNSKTLIVGEAPSPDRPPEFRCVSQSNWNMTCRWNQDTQNNIISRWQLRYMTRLSPRPTCCWADPADGGGRGCPSSVPTQCTVDAAHFHEYLTYTFLLLETNALGSTAYNYTVWTDDSIMMLSPVSGLKAVAATPGHLTVSWIVDVSPASVKGGISCNVSMSSEWEPSVYRLQQYDFTQMDMDVKVTISGLEPYTAYVVNVTCRASPSTYWSEYRAVTERTLAEAPMRNPALYLHSFAQIPVVNGSQIYRRIFLYWKPVARRFWSDRSIEYVVATDDDDGSFQTFPGDAYTAPLRMRINDNKARRLEIFSRNDHGRSNGTELTIPATKHTDRFLSDRLVVQEIADDMFTLSVGNVSGDMLGLTYCWCLGQYGTYPPICKNTIKYRVVKLTDMQEEVIVTAGRVGMKWYFGAALDTYTHSGEIVWSTCQFSNAAKSTEPETRESLPRLSVSRRLHNESVIDVHFGFRFCRRPRRPLLYQLLVADTIMNCTSITDSSVLNATASPDLQQLTTAVDPHADSTICVNIIYDHGDSELTEPSHIFSLVTDDEPGEHNDQPTSVVVYSLVAVSSAITTICLLIIVIKYVKKKLKPYEITMPEITVPPDGLFPAPDTDHYRMAGCDVEADRCNEEHGNACRVSLQQLDSPPPCIDLNGNEKSWEQNDQPPSKTILSGLEPNISKSHHMYTTKNTLTQYAEADQLDRTEAGTTSKVRGNTCDMNVSESNSMYSYVLINHSVNPSERNMYTGIDYCDASNESTASIADGGLISPYVTAENFQEQSHHEPTYWNNSGTDSGYIKTTSLPIIAATSSNPTSAEIYLQSNVNNNLHIKESDTETSFGQYGINNDGRHASSEGDFAENVTNNIYSVSDYVVGNESGIEDYVRYEIDNIGEYV